MFIGAICGLVISWAAWGYMNRCEKHTIRFRIEGADNQPYHYIMLDGIAAQSYTKYEIGDLVCL